MTLRYVKRYVDTQQAVTQDMAAMAAMAAIARPETRRQGSLDGSPTLARAALRPGEDDSRIGTLDA